MEREIFRLIWGTWALTFLIFEAYAVFKGGASTTLSWQFWELRATQGRFLVVPLIFWLDWHFILEPVILYSEWRDDVLSVILGLLLAVLVRYKDPDSER